MPSKDDMEVLRTANRELSDLVAAELSDLLGELGDARPEFVRNALLDLVPVLVEEYGEVASTIAAEWFEEVYGVAPVMGEPVRREVVERGVRYSAGHLWTETPGAIEGSLLNQLDSWVQQPGRETLMASASRNQMRWARVPAGGKTCAFCLLMASRSGELLYRTRQSAGDQGRGVGDRFHGNCRCLVVPARDASDIDWNPEPYFEMYEAAVESAGGNYDNLPEILKALRRDFPDHVRDAVLVG